MDIKKLELLADVAETLNFTKTGERTGYTQSGVSHVLKGLESELGFSLFIRTKKGVVLTSYAEAILPYIKELLHTNQKLEQTISSLKGMTYGQLTIGTFASISIHWLPPIIRRFRESYPNITIKLMEGGAHDIETWIEQGVVDIGFFSRPPKSQLEWIPLLDDPMMAVLPRDSAPGMTSFPVSQFLNRPYILHEEGFDYDVEGILSRAGVTPQIQFTSTNDHVIISMVSNHLGISLMPKLMLKGYEETVTLLPIDPPASRHLGIGMIAQELLTPAAKEFLRFVETTELRI